MGKRLEKVSRKDLIYVIIFLVIAVAVLLLRGNLGSSEVVNVISIGAGLTSIFLALVAIAYAFKQSDESAIQNQQLTTTVNEIRLEVKEFSNIRNELVSVKDAFANLSELSENNSSKIMMEIEGLKEIFNLEVNAVIEKARSSQDTKEIESVLEKMRQDFINDINHINKKDYKFESNLESDIASKISSDFEIGDKFTVVDILDKLSLAVGSGQYTSKDIREVGSVLRKFVAEGLLMKSTDINSSYYVKMSSFLW